MGQLATVTCSWCGDGVYTITIDGTPFSVRTWWFIPMRWSMLWLGHKIARSGLAKVRRGAA